MGSTGQADDLAQHSHHMGTSGFFVRQNDKAAQAGQWPGSVLDS